MLEMEMDKNIILDGCIVSVWKEFHFYVASVGLRCSLAFGALRNLAVGSMELLCKVMD